MLKTHEKSRFEVLNGTNVRDTKRIVVQIGEEKLYTNPAGMACFLCETVDPEDYNRATAQNRNGRSRSEDRSAGRITGRSKGRTRRNEKRGGRSTERKQGII